MVIKFTMSCFVLFKKMHQLTSIADILDACKRSLTCNAEWAWRKPLTTEYSDHNMPTMTEVFSSTLAL